MSDLDRLFELGDKLGRGCTCDYDYRCGNCQVIIDLRDELKLIAGLASATEKYELVTRRALSRLRHMYQQMACGHVRPAQEDISRIADGILSPVICALEDLAESMRRESRPDMPLSEFPIDFTPE